MGIVRGQRSASKANEGESGQALGKGQSRTRSIWDGLGAMMRESDSSSSHGLMTPRRLLMLLGSMAVPLFSVFLVPVFLVPVFLVPLLLLTTPACGDVQGEGNREPRGRDARPGQLQGEPSPGAEVVSTIDGEAIGIRDVIAAAELGGVDAPEALRQLQDEILLLREARRRGYAGDALVQRQVLAQATLEAIENEQSPEAVPAEEVQGIYDANPGQTHQPARRGTRHVLVRVPEGASDAVDVEARSVARALLEEARVAESPGAFFGAVDLRRGVAGEPLVVEALPALPRRGALEEPYAEAMFRRSEPGLVPDVIRTSYGWHVIWVIEATEESTVPLSEADPEIRSAVAQRNRNRALEATFEARHRDVIRNEDAIATAFSNIIFGAGR